MPSILCNILRAACLTAAALQTASAALNLFEEVPGKDIPENWAVSRTPRNDQSIQLMIAVRQRNVEHFEKLLVDISTPDHPKYGQHMEGHEVKTMLKPTQVASDAVIAWLQDSNVTDIEDDGDWINFKTDVGTANKMMNTKFLWYKNDYKGAERLRTLKYSVPDEIAQHINMVQPTIRFGNMDPMRSTIFKEEIVSDAEMRTQFTQATSAAPIDPACNSLITPQCLFQIYNIHYGASANIGNKVGYASFLEQYARYSDLALFEENIATYAIGQNFSVISINGGLNDQTSANDSGEANLDQQYVLGVSAPVPVTEFTTAGRGPLVPDLDQPTQADNFNEPYLDYLNGVVKLSNSELPQVISHSYGENEQSVPASFNKRVCNLFAQLGARGVTILFSSGDSGVGSACLSNDGKNTTQFQPAFPAACPWLTSVGGTRYIEPEVAVNFSGGGFSRLFPRPLYQELAVRKYLSKLGDQFKGLYNANGRGYPDIAAQAVRYRVYDKGVLKQFQGTSCSSPTIAGIVALLNDARIKSHLPTLGFLNPWLYAVGRFGLNDITLGGNNGCNGRARFDGPPNGSPVIPYAGFNATDGWDPVTGYGTPDFGKLLKLSTPWAKNEGGPVP